MDSSWLKSPFMDANFVVKLGVSTLFLGVASLLIYDFSPASDSSLLEKSRNSAFPVISVDSQENADQIPAQESTRKEGKCDIFTGDWIPYKEEPLYNGSCSFITDQNCIKNGRPDTDYLYWRWKPRGCELPRFDPAMFLELMRNKSWGFIGDSISRNHIQSFLCILSTVGKAVGVYHDKNYKSQTWLFPLYNFTASVIWSPFLAEALIPEDLDGAAAPEIELHLDKLDKSWTKHYKTWDYVIFSSGKWFSRSAIYYENDVLLGCHYCKSSRNFTDPGLDFAYRRVIRNLLDYITGSGHKGRIFYRTTTPDHFEGGEWYNGGACRRTGPAKEGEFELNWLDKILREIELEELVNASARAAENGVKFGVFDVNAMSLLRPDGHPGAYRFYQPFGKDKDAKVFSDCMHWCLPGPIDTWNHLLMEVVVNG